MNITNTQPVFNSESFGLGEDGQVADRAQFCVGLQALIDRPREAIDTPQLVERVFKTIDKAVLSDWPDAEKVQGLVERVFEKWMKVSLGGSFRHIPRVRLENDCGPSFKAQYTGEIADVSKHELELSLPENAPSEHYPAKLTEALLSHLQTGEVSEDGFDKNILDLLSLALLHTQEPLVKGCVNFLVENLDFDNLDSTLDCANESSLPQLKWACYRFLQENLTDIPMELQNKYRTQFDLVKSLLEKGIKLRFSPSGQTELYFEGYHNEILPLLKRITDETPVHSIVMSDPILCTSIPFLVEVAPHFPELQELIICNAKPTDQEIPKLKKLFPKLKAFGNDAPFLKTFEEVESYLLSFAKPGASEPESGTLTLRSLNLHSIKNLDKSQMHKLAEYLQDVYHLYVLSSEITSVVVPNATMITCSWCTALETLNANHATQINCKGCKTLKTLTAPKATVINCVLCEALETVTASQTKTIDCRECTALKTLDLPNATVINCDKCSALTTLKAIHAKEINCSGCSTLKTLTVPRATYIDCKWCWVLETLYLPWATKIDCSRCEALSTLDANSADQIDCTGCKALTALEAPKVTQIDCQGCVALTTLNANDAGKVLFQGCTKLTTLNAPNATSIYCQGFEALTTLNANRARKVVCDGCKALTTLDAKNATEIDCSGCEALTTLEAPMAENIRSRWCKTLKTLIAPEATMIFCESCTALETLTAPRATRIDCNWCEALTTLDAPQAILNGGSRFRIWTRRYGNQIRSFWNAALAFLVYLPNRLRNYISALFRK